MKLPLFLLGLLTSLAHADTPPARAINSQTYDAAGNAITSTVNGAKRGLDEYNVNPVGAPVFTQTVVSGAVVDPRAVRALTSADVVTAQQGSPPWSFNLTQFVGSAPGSTNPLPFRLTDGTSFYDARQIRALSTGTDSVNASLSAGSNLVGKFGIDQTTPGTTNGVQVNAALPTGTNSIGQVTANAGTNLNTSSLALSATQTNGNQKTQVVDASGNVMPSGDVLTRKVFTQSTDGTNSQGFTSSSEAKVQVANKDTISSVNSSGVNLTGGATFTGTFESILGYTSVLVLLNSDSLAASNALQIDFSSNGTTVDRTVAIGMNTSGDFAALGLEGQFVRIRVTAGVAAQTVMHLQTIYSALPLGNKYTPLVDTLTDSSSALVSRSVLFGKVFGTPNSYVALKVNSSGAATVEGSSGAPGTPAGGIMTIQGVTGMTPVGTNNVGVKSTANSTTAQLTAAATFTGTGESVLAYQNIQVSGRSDQTGTYKGQWSNDGTTWFDDDSTYALSAGGTFKLSLGRAFAFFRPTFTNTGGSTTTTFFLSIIYDGNRPKPSSTRIGDAQGQEGDAELVKASLTGIPLVVNSPTAATVGNTSASALAANSLRKGLILVNTSINRISCAFGVAAVLNSGITLYPGGTYSMTPFDTATGQVNCIASLASSNLAIQEYQ